MRRLKHVQTRRSMVPVLDIASTREAWNPLKELTVERALEVYNQYRRGEYGDFGLICDALEEYDDILGTLVELRDSALLELPSDIVTDAGMLEAHPELQALADEQKMYLEDECAKVTNWPEAWSWLSLASFRKFSHLEIVDEGGRITLDPIEQWYWRRPIRRGPWYYNASSYPGSIEAELVDMSRIMVREVRMPINVVALFAIVKKYHAEAGWDGFLDVFGNPALFFEMPPDTDDAEAEKYDELIDALVGDGRGSYANGGKIVPIETVADKGENFASRMDRCDKAMVLRGTGGTLLVLAQSGTGTLAGNAQEEVFRKIAAKEGVSISSVIQEQFCRRRLEMRYGQGCKVLARYRIGVEEDDTDNAVTRIATLATAGYRVSDDQVTELTGLTVTSQTMPIQSGTGGISYPLPIMNREAEQSAPLPPKASAGQAPLTETEAELIKSLMRMPSQNEIMKAAEPIEAVLTESVQNGLKTAEEEKSNNESQRS